MTEKLFKQRLWNNVIEIHWKIKIITNYLWIDLNKMLQRKHYWYIQHCLEWYEKRL